MWILYVVIGLMSFIADQWSKVWALEKMSNIDTLTGIPEWNGVLIKGIPHLFEFVYKSNTAGAMGIHFPWARYVLIVATFILLIALIVYICNPKNRTPMMCVATALLIGGGVGNLVDRIFRGYVPDFIRFVHNAYFPYVFNVADVAVCVGAVFLAIHILISEKKDVSERGDKNGRDI